MKVWIYVEGRSDELALRALWQDWLVKLREAGHGIELIPLGSKSTVFKKLGHRAAEKLFNNDLDLAVGLPDLYPNAPYNGGSCKHSSLQELENVQRKLVKDALLEHYGVTQHQADTCLSRFYPSALKHDLEMLLLAAKEQLRAHLGTQDALGNWRKPVEEQNQDNPPKKVVENLFQTKSRKRKTYRDTLDAPAVLGKVQNPKDIICDPNGTNQCPVFEELMNWIGEKTGVPAF